MNELKVFDNPTFGQVRSILKDDEPWFVAADVCRALEIINHKDALTRLDEDEKSQTVSTKQACTPSSLAAVSRKPKPSSVGSPMKSSHRSASTEPI